MILSVKGAAIMWRETEGFTGAKLLKVLLADQVLCFLVYVFKFVIVGTTDTDWEGLRVMLCLIANIVGFATNFGTFFSFVLYVCGSPSLLCVLGNHLLIHLKETGGISRTQGTSCRPEISSMDFIEGHAPSGIPYPYTPIAHGSQLTISSTFSAENIESDIVAASAC